MHARSIIVAAVLMAVPHIGIAQELTRIDDQWNRYLNARFGTSIDVPNIFKMADPPPANGDGRTFRSADGAELRVFGSYSATTITENFAGYKAWRLDQLQKDGVAVTYKAQGKNWLAASGTKDDSVVYVKIIDGCGDATHEMWVTYPSVRKRTYDPLIARLARSLHCEEPR
ncbi:MAG TPA: hypothetical protein VEZ24_08675 [Microvirga sp.]|nr:hypothetical protein [Microvirga sp.]